MGGENCGTFRPSCSDIRGAAADPHFRSGQQQHYEATCSPKCLKHICSAKPDSGDEFMFIRSRSAKLIHFLVFNFNLRGKPSPIIHPGIKTGPLSPEFWDYGHKRETLTPVNATPSQRNFYPKFRTPSTAAFPGDEPE